MLSPLQYVCFIVLYHKGIASRVPVSIFPLSTRNTLLSVRVPVSTLCFGMQYIDGDLWIEAFEAPTPDQSQTMTVVNIYR